MHCPLLLKQDICATINSIIYLLSFFLSSSFLNHLLFTQKVLFLHSDMLKNKPNTCHGYYKENLEFRICKAFVLHIFTHGSKGGIMQFGTFPGSTFKVSMAMTHWIKVHCSEFSIFIVYNLYKKPFR